VGVKEGKMDKAVKVLKEIVPKIKEAEQSCLTYTPHKEALKVYSGNLKKSLEKLLPLLEPGMDVKTCYEIV
jgi:hypothetical protein